MENGRVNFLKNLAAALLAVMVAVLSMAAPLQAAEAAEHIVLVVGESEMMVDGTPVSVEDAVPVNNGGRVYIPLRAVAEAFGANVKWEGADTGRITIDRGETHIVMTANRLAYSVNGEAGEMDVAPYISPSAGRAMVPVRFIGEAFGFDITTTKNADGTTAGVIFTAK